MKLTTLLSDVEGVVRIEGEAEVSDLIIDSRKVGEGSCFVPLKGEKVNGHNFINSSINRGCAAVIAEEVSCDISKPYAIVENTRLALGHIAANFFEHPSSELSLIGVTGTNGKTTTTHIINHILKNCGREVGIVGTTGMCWKENKIVGPNTTPESLVLQETIRNMVDDDVSDLCIEVSSHGLERGRLNGLQFNVGVFLNLSQDHLDFHGDMESYFQAKKKFFSDYLYHHNPDAKAIVSADCPYGQRISKDLNNVITFGIGKGNYQASRIQSNLGGSHFLLSYPNGEIEVRTNLIGSFNVSNLLAAIISCECVGIPIRKSVAILSDLSKAIHVDGRLERVSRKDVSDPADMNFFNGKYAFVDYAHTPDALKNVLTTLNDIKDDKKLWVVFGAGGDRDKSKRPIMGEIALELADHITLTNDNPRSEDPMAIIEDILGGHGANKKITVQPSRKKAILHTILAADIGDVILVSGKGHEDYQEFSKGRVPFSDHSNVAKSLEYDAMLRVDWTQGNLLEGFSFSTLAEKLKLNYLGPAPTFLRAKRFSTDTRTIEEGDLFVALSGPNFDGNTYLELAEKKGAAGVIASRKVEGLPTFFCEDPLSTMQNIAASLFDTFSQRTSQYSVAITGSNGKTTTKEFLKAVCAPFFNTHATRGNFNNHIGLPITLSEMRFDTSCLILEMGANKKGDIAELIEIAPTSHRIITSISEAHLEGFLNIAGVIETKSELFDFSTEKTCAIIPENLASLLDFSRFQGRIFTVGEGEQNHLRLERIDAFTTRFIEQSSTKNSRPMDLTLRSPLAGQHNALNLGLALASLFMNGLDKEQDLQSLIQNGLDKLVMPGGRSRQLSAGGHSIFDDAYNANSASIKASLSTWLEIKPKKTGVERIAIIGEMFEMGENAQRIHEDLAKWIGKLDIDILVFVGGFGKQMVEKSEHQKSISFTDAKSAAKWLKKRSPAEVFLKGSRGMKLETIIDDL